MKWLDRFIRDLRIAQAERFVRGGDRLLDIGCFDRTMIDRLAPRLRSAVGVDPLAEPAEEGKVRLLRGTVPGNTGLADGSFDCVTMLAVLEHVRDADALARECARLLAPGGRLIITVPRPIVDRVLAVLARLHLIDGMSLEEHHGYDVARTVPIFEGAGLRLVVRRSFEFGLNCLFVFERPAAVIVRPTVPARVQPASDSGAVAGAVKSGRARGG